MRPTLSTAEATVGAWVPRLPSATATSSSSARFYSKQSPGVKHPCQVSEADYPYVSGTTTNDEDCGYDLASLNPVASITGYNNLPPNDQDAIMAHLANVSLYEILMLGANVVFIYRLARWPSQWLRAPSRTTTAESSRVAHTTRTSS